MYGRLWKRVFGVVGMMVVFVAVCCGERADAIPMKLRTMIQRAIPEEAIAPVKRGRRVLVCGELTDDSDDMTHVIEAVLRELGDRTGAYSVTIDEDGDLFDNKESFTGEGRFDAIVFVNDVRNLFTTQARQDVVEQYVKAGGGLVVLGDGMRTTEAWPALGELVGGNWGERGSGPEKTSVLVMELEHRVNQGFDEPRIDLQERICRLEKGSFSPGNMRILLSVSDHGERGDGPRVLMPVSWIRRTGGGGDDNGGRVFAMTLGTDAATFLDMRILSHLRRGLQFATGDLEADAQPSGELEMLLTIRGCIGAIRRLSDEGEGVGVGGRWAMSVAAGLWYDAVESGEAGRTEAQREVLDLYYDKEMNEEGKLFAVREMRVTGGEEALGLLMGLLGGEDLLMRNEAIFALSKYPPDMKVIDEGSGKRFDVVNQRLFAIAADKTESMAKRADCVTVLRERGASEYLKEIHDGMMNGEDGVLRRAAIRYIGRVDHPIYVYGREMIKDYLVTDDEEDAKAYAAALIDMFRPGNGQMVYGPVFTAMINQDGKIEAREAERACLVAKGVGGYRGSQMVIMLGKSDDPAVWRAMEDALVHWPNAMGNKAVMVLIEQEKVPVDREVLSEVFVRMIGEMEESPAVFRSSALGKALQISEWDGVDIQAFRALAYVDDFSSIDAVLRAISEKSYSKVKTIRAAARALVVVTERIGDENIGKGEMALNKAIEMLSVMKGDARAEALLARAKRKMRELRG